MSLDLPTALVAEKNKLDTTSAWLWFLSVTLPDSTVLRYVRNTEDITFGGNVYFATYFKISGMATSIDGEIPQVVLKVANAGRRLTEYVNDHDGLEGCDITLTRVNSKNLSADYSELESTFRIAGFDEDEQFCNFRLGAPNLLHRKFPLHELTDIECDYVFKDPYCGYSGAETTCDGTIEQCISRGNTQRYGGDLGLQNRRRIIV